MSLAGTIILHEGKYAIECKSPDFNNPQIIRHVWMLHTFRTSGMSWRSEKEAIGKPATIRDGRVSCYLGEGCYLNGELEHGGSTHAVVVETIPAERPKVRKDTELRWHNGAWQKYNSRKGWIAA